MFCILSSKSLIYSRNRPTIYYIKNLKTTAEFFAVDNPVHTILGHGTNHQPTNDGDTYG
ncbi:hypothetical protein C0J52_27449 [Blattella germanica]|nr:hypothetical protein C0J52_27449 [Blattella germanica]